jgi:hypothetical protein
MIQLHIERLPEGGCLATSDEVQGLVAQGRTIQETIEIARDVAKKLIEAQSESNAVSLPPAREVFGEPKCRTNISSLFDLGASREPTDIARDKDQNDRRSRLGRARAQDRRALLAPLGVEQVRSFIASDAVPRQPRSY